jgi:pyruvate/2-oxoglutarate dehydrogenase complex dihydrolipoamide acyltransferase (E2) component
MQLHRPLFHHPLSRQSVSTLARFCSSLCALLAAKRVDAASAAPQHAAQPPSRRRAPPADPLEMEQEVPRSRLSPKVRRMNVDSDVSASASHAAASTQVEAPVERSTTAEAAPVPVPPASAAVPETATGESACCSSGRLLAEYAAVLFVSCRG